MPNTQKIILAVIGLVIILGIAAAVIAVRNNNKADQAEGEETYTPCQKGDNYDIYTGEPCQ
jgi:hypothetical protein